MSTTITFTGIAVNPVGYLAATAESGQVTLYWSTPVSPQYSDSVIALRNPTSVPTETLTDFTSYGNGATVGSSTVIKVLDTDGASVVDGGLTNGLKYYYKIFNAYKDLYSETSNLSIDSTPTPGTGGTPAWTYSLAGAGASLGIPLTQGSRVIAARGNRLFALDRATGAQDWITSPLGGSVEGWLVPWPKSGTYSDVLGDWTAYTLYAGATDGKAYAFDTSGNQVWASGVLGDGIQATVSPQSWDLEFLNPDFQLTYTDGAGGPMDVVFVATRNGSTTNNTVSALRGFAASGGTPDGGTSIWTFDPQNLVPPAPMDIVVAAPQPTSAPHNLVIVGSYSAGQTQPSLWAINGVTGVNGPAGALVASKGVLGNGPPAHLGDITSEVTFGYACWDCWEVNTIYAGTASGYVVALNLPDLTEKWAANFDAGSPIVGYIWEDLYDPGTLYFTTQDGYVRAIRDNGASATELWRTATAIPSASSPVVDEDRGTLWVGGSGGRLVEIDTASGAMTTAFPGEAAETLGDPTVDFVGGRVYVGSSAGRLHAVPIPLP
ncbi:MAG: PQQ-binding-like beta-propeller repeat protein [Candidatus Rokubacteria bacterium]|nr:PQQ-binding-like beta-propeller repeat protein [Candidatus Rokubacteria bacterium]